MCKELEQVLKLEQDLTQAHIQILSKHNHYRWDIKVKNSKRFKRALAQYQESHSDVDIFSEDISHITPLLQYVSYILGGFAAIISMFAILF